MASTLFKRCKAIFNDPHIRGLLADKLHFDQVVPFEMLKHLSGHFGSHRVILDDFTRSDPDFAVHFNIWEIVWVIFFLALGAKDVDGTFSPVSTFGAF